MNRQRRSAYMAEMGIEHWVPVKALQGAASGHWIAIPPVLSNTGLQSAGKAPIKPLAPPGANRGRAIAQVLDLVDNAGLAGKATTRSTQSLAATSTLTPIPTSTETSTQKTVASATVSPGLNTQQPASTLAKFTLASVVCDDILLVDDITAMQFAGSAYQNWINALLFALARPLIRGALVNNMNDSGSKFDRFSWPLPDSDLFDNTEQGAKEVVSAWLQRKLHENQPGWVVLMGDAAIATLSNSTVNPVTEQRGTVTEFAGQPSIKTLATFGTGQLWREPLLKAQFWQHLQQLRAAMPNSKSSQ